MLKPPEKVKLRCFIDIMLNIGSLLYKDAPLSGFRKCHEKEACTVNVSEETPQKHFQVVQYVLAKTATGISGGKGCGQGYKHFAPCNAQNRFSSVLVRNGSGPQAAGSMPH
jgi:hypothetical protein